jgi:uncharacterized peroxidase-related enzyme
MSFIQTVPVTQAAGEVRAMYERSQAGPGYVPNYAKVFSHRPAVWAAWQAFLGSVRSSLDPRRYELVTVAAARALGCSYCALAHGKILRDRFYTALELAAIVDGRAGALTAADAALMAFAERVAHDASAITAADVQALRDHGLSDPEIFDVAAAAAARCFFSKLLDALGAEPDQPYAALEDELRDRLAVGRPIATAPAERVPPAGSEAQPGA